MPINKDVILQVHENMLLSIRCKNCSYETLFAYKCWLDYKQIIYEGFLNLERRLKSIKHFKVESDKLILDPELPVIVDFWLYVLSITKRSIARPTSNLTDFTRNILSKKNFCKLSFTIQAKKGSRKCF